MTGAAALLTALAIRNLPYAECNVTQVDFLAKTLQTQMEEKVKEGNTLNISYCTVTFFEPLRSPNSDN